MKLSLKIPTALVVFISRFGMLPANVSPLGSFGFFSQNPTLYFVTILAFDYFKGGFYKGFIFTYLGFAGYYLLGKIARNKLKRQLVLLPLASFVFFLFSNFGSWFYWYPRNLTGLIACYTLALPFYQRTLLGDLVFGYMFILLKKLSYYFQIPYLLNAQENIL